MKMCLSSEIFGLAQHYVTLETEWKEISNNYLFYSLVGHQVQLKD